MEQSQCSLQDHALSVIGQLPDTAVSQLMELSQSFYRSTADVFVALQDWGLHSNHLFPEAKRYSPHHCPACGLIERATQALSSHHKLIDTCVRRILLDRERVEQHRAAVLLYAWVAVHYTKELGLVDDASELEEYALKLLHTLVPERFGEGSMPDATSNGQHEPILLAPLCDEPMGACVQAFTETYRALALAYAGWRKNNPDLCPALFVETEASLGLEICAG